MRLRGIVQSAVLEEIPPGSDTIELVLRLQGAGPGQPRTVILPYALLLEDNQLDPEFVTGRRFEAEVTQVAERR